MGISLLDRVAAAAEAAARHVSRASRRLRSRSGRSKLFLLSRRSGVMPFIGRKKGRDDEDVRSRIGSETTGEEEEEVGEGVWRRSILMGEKCQPLDFSGVIYYDADGRQLADIPTTRSPFSPMRRSSASSSSHLTVADRNGRN